MDAVKVSQNSTADDRRIIQEVIELRQNQKEAALDDITVACECAVLLW